MNFRSFLTRALVAAFVLTIGSQAFAARTTTYFHGDGLGSVVAATNEAGAVLWRKDYAPFGEQIQTAPVAERTSYTGKQHDDVTGLTYFGGRNFDPELGRFVSVDPVGFTEANAMSFNRYLYVNNNPYKYVDPDGEWLNYAAKFLIDVAINVAINYVTTGEMNVGGALKESVVGLLNPIPGKNLGKLVVALKKADKGTPDAGATMGFASKVAHGNSKASQKSQHGYVIRDTHNGNTVCKTGVSGCKLNADGSSPRANRQANSWNKEAGNEGRYVPEVKKVEPAGPAARENILNWEKGSADVNRGTLDPARHARP
jgi:RHS repeat-associated protein